MRYIEMFNLLLKKNKKLRLINLIIKLNVITIRNV